MLIKFLSKHLQLILLLAMLLAIIFTITFLHENFYKTIIESEQVIVLQGQVSPIVFKEKAWERVMLQIDDKLAPKSSTADLNNPFIQ